MTTRIPAVPTLQAEDERFRITKWTFAPGAETGWHTHEHPYCVVGLKDGQLTVETAEGSGAFQYELGLSAIRTPGATHNVVNENDSEFSFVEIEYLGA